jgi:hypothetical protein
MIMNIIATRTINGTEHRVYLEQDTDAQDPRTEWDCDDPETIQQWLDGEVYEYVIERACGSCGGWETVDSLCDMYGYDYAHDTASDALKAL